MLEKARMSMEGGATGLIFGRNVWQREHDESLRFVARLRELLEKYPSLTEDVDVQPGDLPDVRQGDVERLRPARRRGDGRRAEGAALHLRRVVGTAGPVRRLVSRGRRGGGA